LGKTSLLVALITLKACQVSGGGCGFTVPSSNRSVLLLELTSRRICFIFTDSELSAHKHIMTKISHIQQCVQYTASIIVRNPLMSMSMYQCQSKIFSVARIAELLQSPRRCSRVTELCWGRIVERGNVFKRWWKTGRNGDDWMSIASEFRRSDAATGNVRRPTVVSWMEQTVDVMMTSEVGNDQAGQRHKQDRSGMVE